MAAANRSETASIVIFAVRLLLDSMLGVVARLLEGEEFGSRALSTLTPA